MAENLENEDWRTEAPTLSAIPVREVFSVPDGYFDTLNDRISASIYLEELKLNKAESGLSVPQQYFEDLTSNINTKIMLEGLKTTTPVEAYQVPSDYFNASKLAILDKTVGTVGKKSSSKILRLWQSSLLKYASAACFVIVAGLGVYFNQENPVQVTSSINNADLATEQMLFDIDEDVIIEHIETTVPEVAPTATDQAELETYILSNFSSSDLTTNF